MTIGRVALGLVLPALVASSAAGQGNARIEGAVLDGSTGTPLRADVALVGTGFFTRTDSLGRFVIAGLGEGRARIRAHLLGYADGDTTLALSTGTTQLIIRLVPAAFTLGAVRTVAPSADRQRFDGAPTVSTVTVSGAETSRIPGLGEADILRAAATLPGVAARNDYSAGFHVRGGEGDQNLVLLDGMPILNPFHMGGLYGTFIDEAVGSLEVMAGAFPAQYGGRLSSVITVSSVEDRRPGIHSTAEVSLLSSSLALSGAAQEGALSWSIAGRRTYADAVIDAVQDKFDFPYHFQDLQTHIAWRLPRGGRFSFTGYAGKDLMFLAPEADSNSEGLLFDWGNQAVSAKYTQPIGSAVVEQRVGWTRFFTHLNVFGESFLLAHSMDEASLAGSVSLAFGAHDLRAGYDVSSNRGSYRELIDIGGNADAFPDPYATDGDTTMRQRGGAVALYVDDSWKIGRLQLRPGIRSERVPRATWSAFSPRLGARLFVTPTTAISLAGGQHAQWIHAVRNEDLPIRIFDLWVLSEPSVPVSRATHAIAGVEHWLSPSRFVRLEGWGKWYRDLPEPGTTVDPRVRPTLLRFFNGRSYGADLYLRQMQKGRWSGWLSYGYAVTERERDDQRYFPAHDRRHNANLVASWTSGPWVAGMRAALASGTPYTGWAGTMIRYFYDPTTGSWQSTDGGEGDKVRGERNSQRYPRYHRTDASIERRLGSGRVIWRPYLSIVNLMKARNVFAYEFRDETTPPTLRGIPQLPLIPTFGVRVEF